MRQSGERLRAGPKADCEVSRPRSGGLGGVGVALGGGASFDWRIRRRGGAPPLSECGAGGRPCG